MIFMINLSERAYLLLKSVLTGLGLNVADIFVKNQKKDYVLYVMLLKMNFTFCVNVINMQVKGKHFMTL